MRYHVLGVGSIGALVSHHLRQSNPAAPISLITKAASAFPSPRLHPYGIPGKLTPVIKVEREGTTSTSTNYEVERWHDGDAERRLYSRAISDGHPVSGADLPNAEIKSLIVCLKTTDTVHALSILRPRISPSSVITLIQNGMGVFDDLCTEVWPDPIHRPNFILGTTTHGAKRKEGPKEDRWSIRHATRPGTGDIRFGIAPDPRKEVDFEKWLWGEPVGSLPILSPPASPLMPIPRPPPASVDLSPMRDTLEALLSMSQLSPSLLPMPHLHHQLLLKLAINSVINPLTAVLGGGAIPNGALFGSIPSHRLIIQLAQESAEVISAYIHSLAAPHAPAPDVLRLFNAHSLAKRVLAVVRSTAENTSSMATDVSAGRSTEIKHINGYLIELGRRYGVLMPKHRLIYDMVKFTSDINGLSTEVPDATRQRATERRKFIRGGYVKARDTLTPRQMELEEKRIELEEEKLWLDRERLKEERTTRRQLKHATWGEKIDQLAERVEGQPRADLSGKNRKEREQMIKEAQMREEGQRLTTSPTAKSPPTDTSSTSPQPQLEPTTPDSISPSATSVPSAKISATVTTASTPSPQTGPLRSWMDQMISSAPRQERTWDVSATPPTARGPLPKKKAQIKRESSASSSAASSTSPSASTSSATPKSTPLPSSRSMADMMSAMINAAPHQSPDENFDANPTAAPVRSPSISSRPTAPRPPRDAGISTPFASSMDSLISSAPRAERSWDVKGGTLTGYTGSTLASDPSAKHTSAQTQDLSRGGLGSALDGLIAGAPRQERTWDSNRTTGTTGDKGKFVTSRSSGS